MPRTNTARRPANLTTTMVVAIMALTVFRWVTLAESPVSLQFDEAQYWDWSRHLAFGYVSKPPMIAWIIRLTTMLFGDGEAAIRAATPLLHAATAILIYALGRRLYDSTTGFWAALAYATLPSVAYSSLIISTDAALLPFWTLALLLWWRILHKPSMGIVIGLGVCIGLGLLAKYAMIYFPICALAHLAVSPALRRNAPWKWIGLAAVAAFIVIAPNLWWNVSHGWATFSHTADNADWQGTRKGGAATALEFAGGQAVMFGPVFLGILAVALSRKRLATLSPENLFLYAFSLPVLSIVVIQALIAGAHLNWAAPAYAALTVLVVRFALDRCPKWLAAGLVLNGALMLWLCFTFSGAIQSKAISPRLDVFARLRGWDRTVASVSEVTDRYPEYNLLFDERKYAVLFNYYLRKSHQHIMIWPFSGKLHSQFALTNAVTIETGKQAIVVSRAAEPGIEHQFEDEKSLGLVRIAMTPWAKDEKYMQIREFHLFLCKNLKQEPS